MHKLLIKIIIISSALARMRARDLRQLINYNINFFSESRIAIASRFAAFINFYFIVMFYVQFNWIGKLFIFGTGLIFKLRISGFFCNSIQVFSIMEHLKLKWL